MKNFLSSQKCDVPHEKPSDDTDNQIQRVELYCQDCFGTLRPADSLYKWDDNEGHSPILRKIE